MNSWTYLRLRVLVLNGVSKSLIVVTTLVVFPPGGRLKSSLQSVELFAPTCTRVVFRLGNTAVAQVWGEIIGTEQSAKLQPAHSFSDPNVVQMFWVVGHETTTDIRNCSSPTASPNVG
jgi:hypothetical protein